MAYITDRLVSVCARSNVTFNISLHETYVTAGLHYAITKFSRMDGLPNFLSLRATLAHEAREELSYYMWTTDWQISSLRGLDTYSPWDSTTIFIFFRHSSAPS